MKRQLFQRENGLYRPPGRHEVPQSAVCVARVKEPFSLTDSFSYANGVRRHPYAILARRECMRLLRHQIVQYVVVRSRNYGNRLLYRALLVHGQDVGLGTTATNGMLGNKNHGYVYYTLSGTELKDGEV